MNFIKSYKNIIILIVIVTSIVFSTSIIEFASNVASKVGKMFSSSKSDYSNLSSAEYKIKSTQTSTKAPKNSSGSANSSQNEGAKSMFKSNQKEPSPEELDKQIMKDQNDDQSRRKELFERSTRQFDKAVDQKKLADEKFNMDMEREFKDF